MVATFNPGLATAKDRIRQKIGDTATATAQVQDETIAAYLAQNLSELGVARQLCYDLAAKWASAGEVTLDDQQQRANDISKKYLAMAVAITDQMGAAVPGSAGAPSIIVGGLGDHRGPLDCRDPVWARDWGGGY